MTVRELIERLGEYPDETVVCFTYTAGDYWRTRIASEVDDMELGVRRWSRYHDKHELVVDEDEPSKSAGPVSECLILRTSP